MPGSGGAGSRYTAGNMQSVPAYIDKTKTRYNLIVISGEEEEEGEGGGGGGGGTRKQCAFRAT